MSAAIGGKGNVYSSRGEHEAALACFGELEAIRRELGDRRGMAAAIGGRGNVYSARGEYEAALACFGEHEAICRELGDRRGVANAIGNRGTVYSLRGEYEAALECYGEQEAICRELGDRNGVAYAIGNRGAVHSSRGMYEEALACYGELEAICRELGDRNGVSYAIGNRGNVYAARGEYETALECLRQAATEHREIGHRPGLALWLAGTAEVLVELVEGHSEEMPAYMRDYVPGIEPGGWRSMSLRTARGQAEESVAISEELARPDTLFAGRVLLARITAAEGDVADAIAILDAMLVDASDDAQSAELHYRLWRFNATDSDHQAEALRRFQSLFEKSAEHEHRRRIVELTADTTPEASDAAA